MIDEAELRELLGEAAAAFDVPEDGPARVLELATAPTEPRQRTRRVRRPRLGLVGALAVLIAVGGVFVLGTMVGSRHTTPKAVAPVGQGFGTANGANGGSAGADVEAGAAGSAGAAFSPDSPKAVAPAQVPAPAEPPTPAVPVPPDADTAKVVKTGSIQIEVRKGAVGATMNRLSGLATGLGGYVADTKTTEGADNPTGSTTLRVPVNTFENLVTSVRALGTVKAVTTHGQDVTARYVDIQARLAAARATLDQLYTILQKATAVGDVLAVQDRIESTQTNIDELQGELNVVNDQTTYASLSVDVAQTGAPTPGTSPSQSGLRKAWHDAVHGFAHGVEALIAHSGTALLIILLVAAVAAAVCLAWPRVRRLLV